MLQTNFIFHILGISFLDVLQSYKAVDLYKNYSEHSATMIMLVNLIIEFIMRE